MSLGQTSLTSEKEINSFIGHFINQVRKAIGVMIEWNNYIIRNKSPISYQTRRIYDLFRISCLEALSRTIMSYMFAETNMTCVSNVYHYLFDDEPIHHSFEECCSFDSMGMVLSPGITPRFSILL